MFILPRRGRPIIPILLFEGFNISARVDGKKWSVHVSDHGSFLQPFGKVPVPRFCVSRPDSGRRQRPLVVERRFTRRCVAAQASHPLREGFKVGVLFGRDKKHRRLSCPVLLIGGSGLGLGIHLGASLVLDSASAAASGQLFQQGQHAAALAGVMGGQSKGRVVFPKQSFRSTMAKFLTAWKLEFFLPLPRAVRPVPACLGQICIT